MRKQEEIAAAIASVYAGTVRDNPFAKRLAEAAARAAVEALREPSTAMAGAAVELDNDGPMRDDCAHPEHYWRAMIDAILNEKPE